MLNLDTPKTVEEIRARTLNYFAECDREGKPSTITGLGVALGFRSRPKLLEARFHPEIGDAVELALTLVEQRYEEKLSYGACQGAIFALKNMGWNDRQDLYLARGEDPLQLESGSVSALIQSHRDAIQAMNPKALEASTHEQ